MLPSEQMILLTADSLSYFLFMLQSYLPSFSSWTPSEAQELQARSSPAEPSAPAGPFLLTKNQFPVMPLAAAPNNSR